MRTTARVLTAALFAMLAAFGGITAAAASGDDPRDGTVTSQDGSGR